VASLEQEISTSLALRAEVYRKDYDHPFRRHENLLNTVVVLPELKPDRIVIEPDAAVAEGAEIGLRYDAGRLSSWFSFTHARVRDRVAGEWQSRNWDQRELVTGGLAWRDDRWEASLAATWHRGWPTTEVELETLEPFPLVAAGKRNAGNVADYARFDARIARRFNLQSAGELTAFAEIHNLTKRNNDCCVEYQLEDEEEDEVFLDVEPRGSLPLIPSIGVIWRF
jgi:hypothetical protein